MIPNWETFDVLEGKAVILTGWRSFWQAINEFLQRQMLRTGTKQSHVTIPAEKQLVRKNFCIKQA